MKKGHKITPTEANDLAQYHGKILTESVCIMNGTYFIITNCSIFIHNNPTVDDCAHPSKMSYQLHPIGYTRRNKRFNLDYFEFSIRIGELEILATGGFWGCLNDESNTLVPFLGSSITSIPDSLSGSIITPHTRSVFVLKEANQIEPVVANRIMNQYLKNNSMEQWGFHSNRFFDEGFFPSNPLHFTSNSPYP